MAIPCFQWHQSDLILHCHLQPRAASDEIVGLHGNRIKVRITAPPIDGQANAHLCKYLASCFGVTRHEVHIIRGQTGRRKTLRIGAPRQIPDKLKPLIAHKD